MKAFQHLALAAGLIVALACQSSQRTVPSRLPRPFTHAESLAYLDSAEACKLLARPANPDPVALVTEFVRRDNEAQFLQSNAWMDTAYACPGHLPGPDMFTVVRGSRVTKISLTDTIARILVESPLLGNVVQDSNGFVFRYDPRVVVDTVIVTNTPFGWRIVLPQLPDRVLATYVLANPDFLPLHETSRALLRKALDLPYNVR